MKKILVIIILSIVLISNIKLDRKSIKKEEETRAIFVSYIELNKYIKGNDYEISKRNIRKIIKNIKRLKCNTIILQVRSASDAIYKSNIYPMSLNIVNTEYDDYYDVLDYFIKESHKSNVKVIAWINPYRIRTTCDKTTITEKNPAYKYLDTDIVYINNGIYYNPSKQETEDLIVKGVEELLNYDVDGILFDDYFYPDNNIDKKDYEEGMPSGTMDKIVNQFTPDGIGKLLSDNDVKVNEFETNDTIAAYFTDRLNDGTVSYKKKAGEYSEKTPVYVVYAGDTPIAKVELESAGKNAHKFNKWTLGTISFGDFTKNLAEVKITAPTGADVYINGVQVTDTYKTESEVKFAPCLHVSDYVTVPTNDVYDVGQLIAKPDITAKLNGKDLTVDYDKKTGYTIYYPSDDELYKSMESRIYTIAEQYGAYIINRGSLSKLSSYMVGTAAEYVSDIPAIWAYLWGKSYTYQFNNESITNFRKYSDKCFSCDVYYDLYVDYKTGNTTYKTSLTYTFVKQNGTWMLADFLIN